MLEELYAKLTGSGIEGEAELTTKGRVMLDRWYSLRTKAETLVSSAKKQQTLLTRFNEAHCRAVEMLTRTDALLTTAELSLTVHLEIQEPLQSQIQV